MEETSVKELMEEYGVVALERDFLGYRDIVREQEIGGVLHKTNWLAIDFRIRIDPAHAKNGEPHKLEKIEWFAKNELPAPLHSQLPTFIEKYRHVL